MIRKFQKRTGIGVMVFILLIVLLTAFISPVIAFQETYSCSIGIIDGPLSGDILAGKSNIIVNSLFDNLARDNETHGDKMLKFAQKMFPNSKIYYFDAFSENGAVTDDSIISAIEWMQKNEVVTINISLSSKKYSEKLDKFLSGVQDQNIFASYNNLANTFDYPAMYDSVIGVGARNDANKASIKHGYKNNIVVVVGDDIGIYKGNSYLALLKALESTKPSANE